MSGVLFVDFVEAASSRWSARDRPCPVAALGGVAIGDFPVPATLTERGGFFSLMVEVRSKTTRDEMDTSYVSCPAGAEAYLTMVEALRGCLIVEDKRSAPRRGCKTRLPKQNTVR